MKLKDALNQARQRHHAIESYLFVSAKEWRELWEEIKRTPGLVPENRKLHPISRLRLGGGLVVMNAGTDDAHVVRTANRFALKEYHDKLQVLNGAKQANG